MATAVSASQPQLVKGKDYQGGTGQGLKAAPTDPYNKYSNPAAAGLAKGMTPAQMAAMASALRGGAGGGPLGGALSGLFAQKPAGSYLQNEPQQINQATGQPVPNTNAPPMALGPNSQVSGGNHVYTPNIYQQAASQQEAAAYHPPGPPTTPTPMAPKMGIQQQKPQTGMFGNTQPMSFAPGAQMPSGPPTNGPVGGMASPPSAQAGGSPQQMMAMAQMLRQRGMAQ